MTARRLTISAWHPRYGRRHNLVALLAQLFARLRQIGLITDREALVGSTDNDEVIVILEWVSSDAIASANDDPKVVRIMRHIVQLADAVAPATLSAARETYFESTPIDAALLAEGKSMTLWQAANTSLPKARSGAQPRRLDTDLSAGLADDGRTRPPSPAPLGVSEPDQ